MSKNLLPAGLVPPSKTAAYDALIGKSLEQEQPILDARTALLKKGVDTHKGLITQQFIKDLRSVDTGNPIEDDRIRHEMNKNRPTNLYDDKVLNPLMQTLKTEGATDYASDLDLTTKMRGEEHRLWDKDAMSNLDPSDPNYLKKLGDAIEYKTRYRINAPAVTAAATQAFINTDIKLADNTIPDAITATGGNINDPKSFNTRAYNESVRIAANNMAKNNRHIRDRKVFEARAKDLVNKSLKYGKQFSLRMKAEGGETYGSVRMDERTEALSTSMGNMAGMSLARGNTPAQMKAASQAVTRDVNEAFKHMKKFGVSPEQEARIMPSIMQALATTDLIPGSGRRAGFGEARKVLEKIYNDEDIAKGLKPNGAARLRAGLDGKITVGAQSKLRQALRRIYQDRFKNNIPNKILNLQVDTILNEDGVLSTAMSIGRKDAEATSLHREEVSKSHRASKLAQTEKLNEMLGTGVDGTPLNTIYKDTLKRLVDEDTHLKPGDKAKLRGQMRSVYRRMRGYFVESNKLQLDNEGHEALLLGLRRLFVNNVGAQEENTFWRSLGFLADFGILEPGGEMTKGQGNEQLPMLEILYENLPIPERTAAHVKHGLEDLKNKLGAKITTLKNKAKASILSDGRNPYPVPQ